MIKIAKGADVVGITFTFDSDISIYSKIEMNITFGDPPIAKANYEWPTASGINELDVSNVASGEIGYDIYKEDSQYFPVNAEPKLDFRFTTSGTGEIIEATGFKLDSDEEVRIVKTSF